MFKFRLTPSFACLVVACLLAGAFCFAVGSRAAFDASEAGAGAASDASMTAKLGEAYGKLPISFVANEGQTDERVKYMSRGTGYSLFLTSTEAALVLTRAQEKQAAGVKATADAAPPSEQTAPESQRVLRMQLVGASDNPGVTPLEELPGKVNYLVGNDASRWHTNLPTFAKVQFEEIYPGINLVYYGNQRQLEYDFVVSPGANPRAISLQLSGANQLKVNDKGDLVVDVAGDVITMHRPLVYQLAKNGERQEVAGRFVVKGGGRVVFDVKRYDSSRALVIDPVLAYSTEIGSGGSEFAYGIAVDSSGSAYITGSSTSAAYPTTAGSLKTVNNGGGNTFVTKLNPEGTALVYSTFLGGSVQEIGNGIAVDSSGSAYVTGYTRSGDFPTVNPIRGSSGNLLKSEDGGGSWLGKNVGGVFDTINVLVVDPLSTNIMYAGVGFNNTANNGGIYKSTDGGNSWSALNTGLVNASCPALVIDPSNSSILYAALTPSNFSGSGVFKSTDGGNSWTSISSGLDTASVTALAIDPTNLSTLYAGTQFGVFKTTNAGASWSKFSTGINFGGFTAIVIDRTTPTTIYASAGGGGVFKTTNGGVNWAQVNSGLTNTTVRALAIDPVSTSTLYAATPGGGVFKSINAGANWNAVNTGLPANASLASLILHPSIPSTIFAGTNNGKIFKTTDGGNNWSLLYETLTSKVFNALTINPGNPSVIFVGSNSITSTSLNDYEAFVSKLNPQGSALLYSTYLGGTGDDFGQSIAVDSGGSAYVTGKTASSNFILANAFQASLKGGQDAFVTKFNPAGALVYSSYLGGTSFDVGNGIAVDASGSAYLTGNTTSADFPLLNPIAGTAGSVFVTKINQAGTGLAYSTLLGNGTGFGVAVDNAGSAYVTGSAASGFPTTTGAFQTIYQGGCCGAGIDDAFVSKLNPSGDALVYSTYLGGSDLDSARGIALDASGNAYVAGITRSADYPLALGALRTKSPFFKSTDGAASWSNENFGLRGDTVTALALVPATPSTIYAGTRNGVFKTTDGGNNWIALNNGLPQASVSAIVVDPLTPSTIYVSAGSVYKSTDGGGSWGAAGTGLTAGSGCLAVDPSNPSILYTGTYANGVYKTVNGGGGWSPVNNGLTGTAVRAIAIDPTNPAVVYAGSEFSNGGLFKSSDGGASWSAAQTGIVGSVTSLVIDPTNPSVVYASGNSGAFKSTNAAASWNQMPVITTIPPGGISTFTGAIVLDPSNTATIYLVASTSVSTNGIYKSTNGGTTWALNGQALSYPNIGPLVINPLRPSTLYAGVGIFPSSEQVFVTKLNSSGSALSYSTLLGGKYGFGIAVDTAGSAYVTGLTNTSDIPVTPDSYQPFHLGFDEAFITKLSMSYVISGQVLDGNGSPLADASVTLSGAQFRSVVTESDGSYRFINLPEGGSFTVSASKAHYSFTPPSQSFNNLSGNQVANFSAATTTAPFYAISGRITSGSLGLAGASVTLGGTQVGLTSTDGDGNYSFTVPGGGNYTVTPSITGFNLSPGTQTFNNLSANQTADFAAARLNFVVTNTKDHGSGSLHQAILDANSTVGADTITFNIPGAGIQTIADRIALPDITDPLTIDGTTQPGFAGSPLIELNGSNTPYGNGLKITAGNCTIRGLSINSFKSSGIYIETGGNNLIQGNYIGLDATGTLRRTNYAGISIYNSSNNIIGGATIGARNVISANNFDGIAINGGSGNQVQGNFIGTNAAGTAELGNGIYGIELTGSPAGSNLIGGTAPGAGNLISGNQTGISLQTAGHAVQGNLIGTDVTGTQKVGNGSGVRVSGANNLIGGTASGARNVISGNNGDGVSMGFGSNGSMLQGNFIGTDITGTATLGNASGGVNAGSSSLVGGTTPAARNIISGNGGFGNVSLGYNSAGAAATVQGNFIGTDVSGNVALDNPANGITIFSVNNIIGGTTHATRNIISGNRVGIEIGGSTTATITGSVIKGNYIGLNASGDAPLPNSLAGITFSTANNNTIGGTETGAGNVIAFSGGVGVRVYSGTGNLIRGNSIFSNADLGIDIDVAGVSANDAGDTDVGANNVQNFPALTSVVSNGTSTTIQGTLNSKPGTTFTVDFYSNTSCDPSGSGEGARFFDSTQVTTDQSGNASINVTFQTPLPSGRVITATATDPAGNTSEFSSCNSSEASGSVEFGSAVFNVLEDVGSATITVVRTGGSRGTLMVNYNAGGGTATPGADYTPASGTLTFADGETSKSFNIPVVNDGVAEADETVRLTLSGLPSIELLGANGSAVMKIQDDTTPLTVYGTDMSVIEGNNSTSNAVATIYLSAATSRTVTVAYNTFDSATARAGLDYQAVSGTLTFAPGVTSQTITVPIIGDTLDEFDESFTVLLSNPVNASVFVNTRIIITDDDNAPTISIDDVSVGEGNAGTTNALFPVSLSSASGKTVRVSYTTANGSATAGSDYVTGSGLLTFAPGETTKNVVVPINGDTAIEPNETFLVNLTSPSNALLARSQGVGTIVNDDGPGTLQFSAQTYTVSENGGSVGITVTRTGGSAGSATINYATSDGTATAGSDYTANSGTLNFADGETSKNFTVFILNDSVNEGNETVNLTLSGATTASLGTPATAALTIQDSSAASTVQFSQAAYSLTEGGEFFEVTVTRTGDLSSPATVNFATANATADTRTDYTAVAGTLKFVEQASTKRIFIPVTDDLYDEADEMLTLSLSSPSGATLGSPSFATLTILDNDTGTATTNPLDEAQFFVRQHYQDFLNRAPDQGGLEYWAAAITSCNGEPICISQRRTAVSAAFFIELEFRETGFFVYLLHKAARGHRPTYTEFMADRPRVVQGPESEASKMALIDDLMQRSFFTSAYPSMMTPEEYVDKLNFNAGGALSQSERDALVQGMKAQPQTETRASVLRKIVADTDFQSAEDQPSFVLMQYFGYLRRDPDQGGYDFWLGILRQNPANLKVMVCAFITSPEYQQRFSPRVTRVDSECSVITP